MYTALDISKYIVTKCIEDNHPISNLQLQKILYYIQKNFLKNGLQAFSDDIEAWPFGPVVPNVYYKFCIFGAMPITSRYDDNVIASNDKMIIDGIVTEKRKLNPWDMVSETHTPGGAWDSVFNQKGENKTIPVGLIKEDI